MKKNDILFLCQFFYPEHNSSATLPFDTARYLAGCGYSVGAMCGYPKEYTDAKNIPLRETVDGVQIRRLRYLQLKRANRLGRMVNFCSLTICMLLHIHALRRYRCVLVYSNPPILPLAAVLGNLLFGTKIIFVAYDVYPEIAVATGNVTQRGAVAKVMRRINRSLFRRASAVVALTEEMKAFLCAHRLIADDRITVIPNWAHEGVRQTVPERGMFGYTQAQFLISYFGNMGICQDMDTLMRAAELLKEHREIRFFLVGHGCKKAEIQERIAAKALTNVQVLDFLTGERFENALAISDACVVSLTRGLKGLCAPSKYSSYLQAGKAIICIAEQDSYLAREIRERQLGVAAAFDAGVLCREIAGMAAQRAAVRRMGENAAAYYRDAYDARIGMAKYEELVRAVLRGGRAL